jgi:tripartite-type tricarboxylate transporter receptor subunit TctC
MIKKLILVGTILILAVSTVLSCTSEGKPATPAGFYKGKTIDFVVADSAGGQSDLTARVAASYLGGETGANVIVTVRRGASGIEGMNYVYRGNPDGLTMGVTYTSKLVPSKVMNEPSAVYEVENFSYIVSLGRRLTYFFVSPETHYQSVADLQGEKGLKITGSSPSGLTSLGGLTVIKLLGLDARVITGVASESERALTVKRGETAGYCSTIPTARSSIEAGLVKPMFVLATERDALAPDVPAITELVNLTGEDLALVKLWETAFASSTVLAASPGVPGDRLAFLRGLADAWVQDENFREEINTISGYELQDTEYITGEEVTKAMAEMAANLGNFQAIFAELIEKYRA